MNDPDRKKCIILYAFLVLCFPLCRFAGSDPRWWWNDVKVSDSRNVDSVDVSVVKMIPGNEQRTHPVFIVWEEPPGMIGRLFLTASFDGGCSFCNPVYIAGTFGNSRPRLAVAALKSGFYSIQIVYALGSSVEVAFDSVSLPIDGTPEDLCSALQNVASNQAKQEMSTGGSARSPDIAGESLLTGSGVLTHFHMVWLEETSPSVVDLLYARDLAGDGSGWEILGPLTGGTPPSGTLSDPGISMDFMVGETPVSHSAVNVTFVDGAGGELYYLRSKDSGSTFSATGEPPVCPPENIRDAGPAVPEAPVFDTGLYAYKENAPAWHASAWMDWRAGGVGLTMDGKRNLPTGISPAWSAPDLFLDPGGLDSEGKPALSILPHEMTGEADILLVWTDGGAGGYDLFYRGGILTNAIDMSTFPFPPVRSNDPTVSTKLLLTGCAYQESTGDCVSMGLSGTPTLASMDEYGTDAYLAWVDDRSGNQEVWFKRTDRQVLMGTVSLQVSCPTPDTRTVTAQWRRPATCSNAVREPEKLVRYRIYYGTVQGGPYINTDLDGTNPAIPDTIVVDATGLLPDPVQADIAGLAPGVTYYVIVVPEDEARNLYPQDFDPTKGRADTPLNESSVTTPPSGSCRSLYRAVSMALSTQGLFISPPAANDISLASPFDVPYDSPTWNGMSDREQVLSPGSYALVFYQIEGADVTKLRVIKNRPGLTVQLSY